MPEHPLKIYAREREPSAEQIEHLVQDLDAVRRARMRPPARWGWGLVAVAAAAAGLLVAIQPEPDGPGLRGLLGAPIQIVGDQEIHLRLAVERDGVASPLDRGAALRAGERVLFRVSASQTGPATLWVDGPMGTEPIAEFEVAAGSSTDVPGAAGGLRAWRFDAPGRYTFYASGAGLGECSRPACDAFSLEVE